MRRIVKTEIRIPNEKSNSHGRYLGNFNMIELIPRRTPSYSQPLGSDFTVRISYVPVFLRASEGVDVQAPYQASGGRYQTVYTLLINSV